MPVKGQKNLMISLSASRAASLRLPDFNNKSGGALWLSLAFAFALCICLSLFLTFDCSFALPRFLILNKISKMSAVYLQVKTLHSSTSMTDSDSVFDRESGQIQNHTLDFGAFYVPWVTYTLYQSLHLKWQPFNFLSCTGSNSNTKILWYTTTTTCLAKFFPHTFI